MNSEQLAKINRLKTNAELLHNSETIQKSLDALAKKLSQDYKDKCPVFLVVMNGGLIFSGQLLPKLNFPIELDYCHATRYRGEINGGKIDWKVTPSVELKDRHVVILDDILDEGITLQAIIEDCLLRQAKSVKTCVLIEKLHERKVIEEMRPDYCELTTPDYYVFGFGMDCNHYWRNSPEIYILNQ